MSEIARASATGRAGEGECASVRPDGNVRSIRIHLWVDWVMTHYFQSGDWRW